MLHYQLYDYDKDFDYLSDDVPGVLYDYLGNQLERALNVLARRSREQIDYAIESPDWMLRQGGELLFEEAMRVTKEKGHCSISRVKALKRLARQIDISEQSSPPDATWADYFVVLAIPYALEMLHAHHRRSPR